MQWFCWIRGEIKATASGKHKRYERYAWVSERSDTNGNMTSGKNMNVKNNANGNSVSSPIYLHLLLKKVNNNNTTTRRLQNAKRKEIKNAAAGRLKSVYSVYTFTNTSITHTGCNDFLTLLSRIFTTPSHYEFSVRFSVALIIIISVCFQFSLI